MKRATINDVHLWQFDRLLQEPGVRHFVTDRSSGGPGEFTLSYSSTPDKEAVRRNRSLVAGALGVPAAHLFLPSQVHKTRILEVTAGTTKEELMETDALITDKPGIGIAVMSADCVPILIYDRKHQAVGAVHSGWRGTVARILEKTLAAMHARYGTRGEDVLAAIGPSASQDSYEVGEEVINEVAQAFGKDSGLLIPQPIAIGATGKLENKAKLDLWKANTLQLREFGVPESAIEVSDLCTVRNNEYFFSARKGDAGRFAAGIVLV
jgi:YfiH family protein